MKTTKTYRLSDYALTILDRIMSEYDVNQTEAIEGALDIVNELLYFSHPDSDDEISDATVSRSRFSLETVYGMSKTR